MSTPRPEERKIPAEDRVTGSGSLLSTPVDIDPDSVAEAEGSTPEGLDALQTPRVPHVEESESASLDAASAEGPNRTFVPLNREDALTMLAGLVLSSDVTGDFVALPVTAQGIAILHSGLRETEATALAAGRPGRFPVLLELPSEASSRAIRASSILRLLFRSEDDCKDFQG